jgi:nucleoside-diphosphate-sugar epimerase
MSKVYIVTGASRGLGLAIAQVLLKESHKVFLIARSEDELKKLKTQHGDSVDYMSADLADFKVIGFENPPSFCCAVTYWGIGGPENHGSDCKDIRQDRRTRDQSWHFVSNHQDCRLEC